MHAEGRTVWRRYWLPRTTGDAVLRAVVSVAVVLVVGWSLGTNVVVLLACTGIPGLGLLLAGLERVHNHNHDKGSGRAA